MKTEIKKELVRNHKYYLKCDCGFEGEVLKSDKEVICPKCFMIYKKCKKAQIKKEMEK